MGNLSNVIIHMEISESHFSTCLSFFLSSSLWVSRPLISLSVCLSVSLSLFLPHLLSQSGSACLFWSLSPLPLPVRSPSHRPVSLQSSRGLALSIIWCVMFTDLNGKLSSLPWGINGLCLSFCLSACLHAYLCLYMSVFICVPVTLSLCVCPPFPLYMFLCACLSISFRPFSLCLSLFTLSVYSCSPPPLHPTPTPPQTNLPQIISLKKKKVLARSLWGVVFREL